MIILENNISNMDIPIILEVCMETKTDSKIYSYDRDSLNFGTHIIYYVLVILIRSLYINKSNSILSFVLFISCFIALLFSSSLNSPRLLPAKAKGKLLYNGRLIIKIASYFIIISIKTTSIFVIYLIMVVIIEAAITYAFLSKRGQLFYDFEDKDIENKFLRKYEKYR